MLKNFWYLSFQSRMMKFLYCVLMQKIASNTNIGIMADLIFFNARVWGTWFMYIKLLLLCHIIINSVSDEKYEAGNDHLTLVY